MSVMFRCVLCLLFVVLCVSRQSGSLTGVHADEQVSPPVIEEEDKSINEFSISASPELLADLKTRLQLGYQRLNQSALKGVHDWSYGTNPQFLSSLVDHWIHKYDWKKSEERINTNLPQFTTNIDGHTIHFVHQRAITLRALPVLIVHGWPSSFLECEKIISILPHVEGSWAFHVVCPSIPGYGFSSQPNGPGMDARAVADIFLKLMIRLGYTKFLAQGGDWGSIILSQLAYHYPDHVSGLHLNFLAIPPPYRKGVFPTIKTIAQMIAPTWFFNEREAQFIKDTPKKILNDYAYFLLQSTKPQSLGFALNDSPIGLASWLLEKYHGWSDLREVQGDLVQVWEYDTILDMVMIYWISGSISSSMRLYYETFHSPLMFEIPSDLYVKVPTGIAQFHDIYEVPQEWAEYYYNIVHWRVEPYGGHFPMIEEPGAYARCFAAFVDAMWQRVLKRMRDDEKNAKYKEEI